VFPVAIGRAAPGHLDPTFGQGGTVTTNIGWGNLLSAGRSAIRQSDGKIVVGGTGWKGGTSYTCFALVRFNADGSPDVSFGDDGRVLTLFDGSYLGGMFVEGVDGLAQQPDGKLIALGRFEGGADGAMLLLRYGVDGSVDETFGAGGKVEVPLQVYDGLAALGRQPDGKLVVAGVVSTNDRIDLALARFNADGTLDGGFGDTGRATLDVGGYGWANALTIQDDGKLVVAGASYVPDEVRILVARFLPDGMPDPTFGTGGVVVTNPTAGWDQALQVVQQADGRLVVAGYVSSQGDGRHVAVLRYLSEGTLDPSFATGGMWTGAAGGDYATASGVVQQPDGRLVVTASNGLDFATLRFSTGGTLDPTFGSGGVVQTDIGGNDNPSAVLRQPDGKLVVAGSGSTVEDGSAMAVVRYDSSGTLDPTFGAGGISIASVESSWDVAEALVVQSDGKIVAAGEGGNALALVRYDVDGQLDASFGVVGKVTTKLGASSAHAVGIVQQSDGKLVAGGYVGGGGSAGDFAVARFTADGSPDPTFGIGGKRIVNIRGNDEASAFLQQSDGKLVLAGHADASAAFVRYQPDGSLDAGFGTGGILRTSAISVQTLAQQSDGRLLAGGSKSGGSGLPSYAVARFNSDGTLDTTFGTGGTVLLSMPESGSWVFYGVVQQPDGKVVAAGGTGLVRFMASGALDPSFANSVAEGPLGLYAVRRQVDGKLVGAGVDGTVGGQLSLTRYDSIGAIDPLFGDGGVASVPRGAFESFARDVVILPDGKLVAVGYSDTDFAIARFLGDDVPPTTTSSSTTSTTSTTTSTTSTTATSTSSTTTSVSTSSSTSTSAVTTTLVSSSTSSTLGCLDADGDGICDPSDPCINVGGRRNASRGRVSARNLLPPAGDDALVISGILKLDQPIDPVRDGIRVLYRDGQGTILDRIVPAGTYDPLTRTGWTGQGASYRYVNGNGALELTKIVLRGSASIPGQYKVRIKGRAGSFAGSPDALPVYAVVMPAPPFVGTDECGEWRFSANPPACLLTGGGAVLKCR